jgi:phage-related protein
VTFTAQEKEKIATLVESNKMLEAQEMVLAAIEKQVGGTAAATADDSKRMKEGFAQVSQAIGLTLLPILEAVTPLLLGMANWAKENPGTFKIVAAAIGGIALAILAINFAMAANPLTLIAIGIAALIAGVVLAYNKFEGFRKIIDLVFKGLSWYVKTAIDEFKSMVNIVKGVFNAIGSAWNNTFGKISFSIPNIPGLPGRGTKIEFPKIPALADGGIVTGPTLALIGEAGPEAVVPLDRMGGMGGNNITINVQGADPNAVVDALRTYMFRNGSVPIRVS